jgi:translation initiation factor 4E
MWEDESNKSGGKISLKINKMYSGLIWEETLMAVLGRLFTQKLNEDITGVVLSVKCEYDVIQIWFKTYQEDVKFSLE